RARDRWLLHRLPRDAPGDPAAVLMSVGVTGLEARQGRDQGGVDGFFVGVASTHRAGQAGEGVVDLPDRDQIRERRRLPVWARLGEVVGDRRRKFRQWLLP